MWRKCVEHVCKDVNSDKRLLPTPDLKTFTNGISFCTAGQFPDMYLCVNNLKHFKQNFILLLENAAK